MTLQTLQSAVERIPPQNVEAEVAVLGSMLLSDEAVAIAVEVLDEKSFYLPAHQRIYASMVELYRRSKPIDLVTLVDELKKKGHVEAVGGASYLAELSAAVPTAANCHQYVQIVRDKQVLRFLISTATQVVNESFSTSGDVGELLDRAEQMIFDVSKSSVKGTFVAVKDIIRNSIETIDNLYQNKSYVTGLATGFKDLDGITSGFQKSDLVVVAGRPSMGKTAFALSIAEHAGVELQRPVALFSLEMSKEQLVQRLLCSQAKVDAHKVRTGFLSEQDWYKLTQAATRLSEAPIFIDDTPNVSGLEIRAKARRLQSRHQIELIVVDYIQLMRGGARAESRQQEISEISRSLKALARELGVPVIGISQLSRAVESRQDRRPQLSDLRESGAIEQDADVVILLLREEYYNPTEENRGKAEAIVAKQRNGPVGTVQLAFLKECARFEDISFQTT
ncbi:MAG: replicative DNA helicase [Candidatus Omnitrophica bacterium]|nr:replicative DNA helicase [Candidatus Omnitrophota bacterium]